MRLTYRTQRRLRFAGLIAALLAVTYIPALSLGLPSLMHLI